MVPKSNAEPAYFEDADGSSDDNRVKASTKVSATKTKESEKKKERKHRAERKEKKSKSEDGILDVELSEGDVTIAKHVRVISDQKKSSRKSTISAPVNGGHRLKKSSRPAPPRSGTFDPAPTNHHDKNDKRYFGLTAEHTTIASSSRPRTQSIPQLVHPPRMRPMSYQGPIPQTMHYQPAFSLPGYPVPPFNPAMPSHSEPQFGTPPGSANHLASRFGRTGGTTLSNAPLPQMSSRHDIQDNYDNYEEGGYEDELETQASAEEERKRQHKVRRDRSVHDTKRALENRALDERERALDEAEYRHQQRLNLERLDRIERELRDRRDRDSMPPPSRPNDPPRRHSGQRDRRSNGILPELNYPSIEDLRQAAERRGSSNSDVRPRMPHRETEPPMRAPRPSQSRAPPSSASANYAYDLALRQRERERRPLLSVPGSERRSSSYYPASNSTASSSNYEDNLRHAMGYQEEVSGETPALTAEMLKKQQRRIAAGGSRSTRSTNSRDESEMKQSVTTPTTRSGSGDGDEGTTFRVKGNARVNINGAEIESTEADGEIEITVKQKTIRNGSEVTRSELASRSSEYDYASSGTTAVSEPHDFMASRPKPNRRGSVYSQRRNPSIDDPRFAPRNGLRDHHLRSRLDGGGLGRSASYRDSRPATDYERDGY